MVAQQMERIHKSIQRHQLDNGMRCIIKEDSSAPLVSIQIWVGSGSAQEGEYLGGGLSHLIEHMIFKGTPTRKPADIAREIDDAGGSINAYTSLDRTVFLVDMPAERWQTGLDVLADAVTHASFPENEWRREKDVVRREMAMNNDNPDRVLSKLLWQTAYSVHPYRFPVIGREDVFNSLTRDDLIVFFRRHYTPDNMIIVIVGSVNAESVRAAVESRFGNIGCRARPLPEQTAEPHQLSERTARKTGAYNISRLEMAWHTVDLSHPDAPALDVLSVIAGNGSSSRLSRKIKENLKLAFNIDAWSFTPKDAGLFGLSAAFDPAKEKELAKAIEDEISGWRTNSFTAAEVEKARKKLTADTLLAFQTFHGQADTFASGEFYAGTPYYFNTYLKRLSAITPESLTAAANKYLHDQNRTLAILSPPVTNIAAGKESSVTAGTNVVKTVLPGGLTLLCRQDSRLPFVHICVASLGGLLLEDDRNSGITCLMAELLTRGTEQRSQEQIADAVEDLGGSISSFSGMNSCGLQARCFSKDTELFMDILSDCCLRSVFPEKEIAKCKAVQTAKIDQQRESPMFLAQEAMRLALFPGHPYRLNVEGTHASVMAITRDELRRLHDKIMAGSNTVIAVFGDISPAKAKEIAEKFLDKMPAGKKQEWRDPQAGRGVPAEPSGKAAHPAGSPYPGRKIELTAPREQTIVLAGFPGLAVADQRMDALNIMLQALNGLSSDLMINVRDKKGLAYYTGAYHKAGIAGGQLVVYSGTRAEEAEQVCGLIEKEINRVSRENIRAEEFERARLQIISEGRQSHQDDGATAMECALNELYALGYAHGFETEQRIGKLSADDVREAAAAIMSTEKMITVTVRPGKENEEGRMKNAE